MSNSSSSTRPSKFKLALQELDAAFGHPTQRKRKKFKTTGREFVGKLHRRTKKTKTKFIRFEKSEEEKQAFNPLPSQVEHGPLKDLLELPTEYKSDPFGYTKMFINELLPTLSADKRIPYHSYSKRLEKKLLFLENAPKEKSLSSKLEETKKRKTVACKVMSARERRARNAFQIPKELIKFELYLPLHELWKSYMTDLVKAARPDMDLTFLKADFHGALIQVVRSKCPSYVGVSGLVLQETMRTFKIVTQDDRLIAIPKRNNVFTMQCAGKLVTIYGNNFEVRSVDRARKSWKRKPSVEIL